MQDHGEGLKPFGFLSRQLKPTKQRYSAYEHKLAVVAYCFLAWRHYLEGYAGGVTVITDHQTLKRIMDQQALSQAQIRWVRLGLFQSILPTIKYQPGKASIVADALSRSQRGTSDADVEDQRLHKEQKEDEDVVFALTGTTMTMQPAKVKRWKQAQADDPKIQPTIQQLQQDRKLDHYELTPQGLLIITKDNRQFLAIPTSLRQRIMRECHDVPSVGHVGMRRTLELVAKQYHLCRMKGDIADYVRTCPTCQEVKSDNTTKVGLLQPLEIPT